MKRFKGGWTEAVFLYGTVTSEARVVGPSAIAQNVLGTSGDDKLRGTVGHDSFDMQGGGSDHVSGLGGDDYVLFGATLDPTDRVDGGKGYDYVEIVGDYRNLTITGTMLTGVEDFDLGAGSVDMTIAGDVSLGVIDLISTTAGGSRVDASANAGGLFFFVEAGDSRLIGGSGDDVFRIVHRGTHHFTGGAGFDRVSVSLEPAGVTLDLRSKATQTAGDATITLRQIEALTGTMYGDRLTGNAQGNWLNGFGGDDVLLGLGGDDVLGIGAATAVPTDVLADGGNGFDLADFSADGRATAGISVSLANGDAQDSGQGVIRLVSIEGVSGTDFADTVVGNGAMNRLYGGLGNDTLSGGDGADLLYGDSRFASRLVVTPLQGSTNQPPELFVPVGKPGKDLLNGGAGHDQLYGDGGGDVLTGGTGSDILTGGAGRDRFIFTAVNESGAAAPDTITDFAHGDRIDVHSIDADTGARGNQVFHYGATAGHAGDIVAAFDAVADVTTVSFFIDGDTTADMTVLLTGNVALTAADFVL